MEFKIDGSVFRFDLESATVVSADGAEIAWFNGIEVRERLTSHGGSIVELDINDEEVVAITVPADGELREASAQVMELFGVRA